jgi:UDP-glucose 4-epimerase
LRVLVLGGCGFIGSHVVDAMLAANLSVRVLDRGPEKFRAPLEGVDYVFADFRDVNRLYESLVDVDVVVHLISATVPGTAALDPQADVRDNLLPAIAVLEAMLKLSVRKIVYASSGGTVYGVPEVVPTPETHPLRPVNSYGIVKVAIESYVEMYARAHGMSATIIRPSNPYGPRQGHTGVQGVVTTFMNRVLNDEPIHVWGDGSVVRDYVYVEDLATLCVAAVVAGQGGTFNAGSGVGVSINEVVAGLRKVTGRELRVSYQPGRSIDVPRSILDIQAAKMQLGWEPHVSFYEGLERLWRWIRQNNAPLSHPR